MPLRRLEEEREETEEEEAIAIIKTSCAESSGEKTRLVLARGLQPEVPRNSLLTALHAGSRNEQAAPRL